MMRLSKRFLAGAACWLVAVASAPSPARAISAADARTESFRLQSEGMRLYKEGKYREATEAFRRVVGLNLNSFLAYYYLGASLLAERRYGEAIEPLRTALDLQPDYIQAHLALGDAYLKLGDTSEARAEYLRALELQPNYAAAHTGLGEMFERIGEDGQAEQQYRKALEINVAYADAYVRLGDLYLRHDRADDAIELFLKAIAIRPDFSRGFTQLGIAYARQRLYDEAIAATRKSQALAPHDPDPYVALARIYLALESDRRAEAEIQAALAEDHDHPGAHLLLSDLKRALGDFPAAVEVLQGLLERGIEDAQMRRAVADALERTRAAAAQHAALLVAAAREPRDPAALLSLGRFLSGQGAHRRAAAVFEDALSILAAAAPDGDAGPEGAAAGAAPTVERIRFEAGLELLAARRHPDAIAMFERVGAADPSRVDEALRAAARFNSGVARASMGLDEAAAESFAAFVADYPDDAMARLYLGNACLRLNRTDEARAAYGAFLERSGAGPEALRVRRILEALDRPAQAGGTTADGRTAAGPAGGVR